MKTLTHDFEQGTEEWHKARAGKCTASMFSTALDKLRSGKISKKALDYAHRLAHERIAGESLDDTFTTWQMRRGSELEWQARAEYEIERFVFVKQCGLIVADDFFGYSPDGFVGDEGLIEIKTPSSPSVLSSLIIGKDFSEYMHQIQGGMWITGRKWCDLIVYAPQLKEAGKELNVTRIKRDDEFIGAMEKELLEFQALVMVVEKQIREAA